MIKFVSDLRPVGIFFPSTPVSSTNENDRRDIAEILLKVTLNTITPSMESNIIFAVLSKMKVLTDEKMETPLYCVCITSCYSYFNLVRHILFPKYFDKKNNKISKLWIIVRQYKNPLSTQFNPTYSILAYG